MLSVTDYEVFQVRGVLVSKPVRDNARCHSAVAEMSELQGCPDMMWSGPVVRVKPVATWLLHGRRWFHDCEAVACVARLPWCFRSSCQILMRYWPVTFHQPWSGFQVGLRAVAQYPGRPGMRRAWSGAWVGLCNTYFWVDRTSGITHRLHLLPVPAVGPEEVLEMYMNFEQALYSSL